MSFLSPQCCGHGKGGTASEDREGCGNFSLGKMGEESNSGCLGIMDFQSQRYIDISAWVHMLGHRAQLHTLSYNQKHYQTGPCKFLRPDPGPSVTDTFLSLVWGWWDVLHCRNRAVACLGPDIIFIGRNRFGVQYSGWAEWVPPSHHWTCIP